ncbi:unnamed protein product [Brachionus calyciflorus]|uniref:GP-PDE domain-containing protein n=1 Tax=Brachionus calyciflorus TaxID=104777 RepID=A0A813THG2_9BILA|nr:unnamed protein product [Brachionus calyciflorus]
MDNFEVSLPGFNFVCLGIGFYAAASLVLYYYPNFLHGKKEKKDHNFVVVSHRGGSGENRENTLTAFKHSHEIGSDVIELDCHITKDGQVVVSHDNSLLRLCGVNKLISELTYDELPDLLEGQDEDIFLQKSSQTDIKKSISSSLITNELHCRNGNTKTPHKIPLLEDVFKHFPNTHVNLDVKIENDNLINQVDQLVRKYNREHLTVWGSFNERVCKKLHALNPKVGIFFSMSGCLKLMVYMVFGLLPFVKFKESHLEIIMPNRILKKNRDSIPRGYIAALLLVKTFFIRKSFIKHLQKRGISVYYWVLNEEEEFKDAIELGVNGIITDYPSRLIEYIQTNTEVHTHIVRPIKTN